MKTSNEVANQPKTMSEILKNFLSNSRPTPAEWSNALRKACAEPKSTLGGPHVDQTHNFIAEALRRDLGM